jgi:hypothetical protein
MSENAGRHRPLMRCPTCGGTGEPFWGLLPPIVAPGEGALVKGAGPAWGRSGVGARQGAAGARRGHSGEGGRRVRASC